MSARVERKVEDAKKLEASLRAEGRPMDAEIVGRLRRALSSASNTCNQLWHDNMALREGRNGGGEK